MIDPRILEPRVDDEFAEWTREVHRLVRVDTEFPDYPFRNDGFVFAVDRDSTTYGNMLYILEPLVERFGDDHITVWGRKRMTADFNGVYGWYPAYRIRTRDLTETYSVMMTTARPDLDGIPDAFEYAVDRFPIVGSSETWAVWSHWGWVIALVHTPERMFITETEQWPCIRFSEHTIPEIMPPRPWWQVPEQEVQEFFDNLRTYGHLPK
ncbi:MAG TPA: hypothetical protein VK139_03810 [Microbacteriaceae bacterium]|nr:hypothetical protein [Microbacteriaceae bacterium]